MRCEIKNDIRSTLCGECRFPGAYTDFERKNIVAQNGTVTVDIGKQPVGVRYYCAADAARFPVPLDPSERIDISLGIRVRVSICARYEPKPKERRSGANE